MRCPNAPKYQSGTKVYGLTDWDPTVDEAIYQAVAQYTCPEGYVFQIYQDDPDPVNATNFGLIEDETSELNVTCAAFADWSPSPVPPCIRKATLILFSNCNNKRISAINCTDDPFEVPNNDKGVYDWDGFNKSFGHIIRYHCRLEGWGYPGNGLTEMYSMCQANKNWNLTEVENCICKLNELPSIISIACKTLTFDSASLSDGTAD